MEFTPWNASMCRWVSRCVSLLFSVFSFMSRMSPSLTRIGPGVVSTTPATATGHAEHGWSNVETTIKINGHLWARKKKTHIQSTLIVMISITANKSDECILSNNTPRTRYVYPSVTWVQVVGCFDGQVWKDCRKPWLLSWQKKGVPVKSPFNQFYGGWAKHFDWILCHLFGEKTRVFDSVWCSF